MTMQTVLKGKVIEFATFFSLKTMLKTSTENYEQLKHLRQVLKNLISNLKCNKLDLI